MACHKHIEVIFVLCITRAFAAYDQYMYNPPKYHLTSYQTYDKRALKDYNQGYGSYTPSRNAYSYDAYGTQKNEYGTQNKDGYSSHGNGGYGNNDGYGYQTRTTFVEGNKYYIPKPQNTYSHQNGYGESAYNVARQSYYKQAQPAMTYYETPFSKKKDYVYEVESYNQDKKPTYQTQAYKQKDYGYETYSKPKEYGYPTKSVNAYNEYNSGGYGDPCSGLPEGDYALQAEFNSLYPGVDSQCNFIKCANYKSYINPCSIGTKNDEYGGPHPKRGFCAEIDYKHYCGVFPPAPPDNYGYES